MQLVELIIWIIIGGIAGWLAGLALKSGGGALIDIAVGILGALVGGLLVSALGLPGTDVWSIFAAVIGAVVLLAAIRLLNLRRRHHIFN
jgi:uncharacterized membrane protein YeaQ/YmgE (transglycosylase-associated protein family)